jgi:hypothetical protein
MFSYKSYSKESGVLVVLEWSRVVKRLDLIAKGAWFIYLIGSILFYLSVAITKNISRRDWIIIFGMVGFNGWMANIILFFYLILWMLGRNRLVVYLIFLCLLSDHHQ